MKRSQLRRKTWWPQRNKFGNIETEYGGHMMRSKAEATYAMWLDSEKRKGRIKSWKYEVNIELHAPGGKKVGAYQVDFEVTFPDNHKEWHEVKGRWTALAKWKVKHTQFEYNRVVKVINANDLKTK